MRLSDSLLLDVLNGLRGARGDSSAPDLSSPADAPAADSDRRRDLRVPLGVTVPLTRHGAIVPSEQSVILRDICARGVGLVLRDAVLGPGEQVVVHAPRPRRERRWWQGSSPPGRFDLLCTVRAVRVRQDGRVYVGAEFGGPGDREGGHGPDPSAAVPPIGLADASVATGPSVRGPGAVPFRKHQRVAHFARAQMYEWRRDGSRGPMENVQVIDYSDGGIRVLRPRAMDAGDEFVVRFPGDEGQFTALCRVSRVVAHGDGYAVGAGFIPFERRRGRAWISSLFDWVA